MSYGSDLVQALNAYRGAQQGGLTGYGSAAANTARLYGSLSGNTNIGNYGVDLGDALGIYGGVKSGTPTGYAQAGVNAAQLGANLGAFGSMSPQVGQYAGYAAIPLSLYNEVENWQSGATGQDALGGAESGAAIGSAILPGVGTLIGAGLGAVGGALSSAFGSGKVDPENAGFNAYTQAYNSASTPAQKAAIASGNQDPYETLAGYFDLRSNQVKGQNPLYQDYGRMGEQAFTNDLVSQINNAYSTGKATIGESGQDVYNQVVQPWLASKGTWNDTNKDALSAAIEQMTNQYVTGQAANDWKAVGGDSPFQNIYQGSGLQQAAQQYANNQAQTQAQQAVAAIPQNLFKQPGMGGATTAMPAARGGHVNAYERAARLRELYKGGLRKTHYDDGGGVPSYLAPYTGGDQSNFSFDLPGAYAPSSGTNASGIPTDIASPDNSGAYGMGYYNGSSGSPYGAGSSGSSGGGSGLAGLLSSLGISGSTASSLAPYAALAPILGSMLGIGTNQGQAPSLPSQYTGQALNMSTPNFTRQQNNLSNMSMNDWLHAGEGPEIQFYQNNALPATQMSAPNQQAAQALSALSGQPFAGGYQYSPITGGGQSTVGGVSPGNSAPSAPAAPPSMTANQGYNLWMHPMAAGGPYDDPHAAYSQPPIGHVRGPGDGTSDSIQLRNAYLSNGEYVMDAPTLSMIGNGSNDAGAKWMDGLRAHVRKTGGKHLVKGKQPMNTMSAADAYAYGGAR